MNKMSSFIFLIALIFANSVRIPSHSFMAPGKKVFETGKRRIHITVSGKLVENVIYLNIVLLFCHNFCRLTADTKIILIGIPGEILMIKFVISKK